MVCKDGIVRIRTDIDPQSRPAYDGVITLELEYTDRSARVLFYLNIHQALQVQRELSNALLLAHYPVPEEES